MILFNHPMSPSTESRYSDAIHKQWGEKCNKKDVLIRATFICVSDLDTQWSKVTALLHL